MAQKNIHQGLDKNKTRYQSLLVLVFSLGHVNKRRNLTYPLNYIRLSSLPRGCKHDKNIEELLVVIIILKKDLKQKALLNLEMPRSRFELQLPSDWKHVCFRSEHHVSIYSS